MIRHAFVLTCALAAAAPAAAQAPPGAPQKPFAPREVPPPITEEVPTAPAAEELKVPTGERWLGTVRIPTNVLANGKPLPAGTYRVRLTGETADDVAVGQLAMLERWVEFVQGKEVKGRAMAPVVPARAVPQVADSRPPPAGRFRIERLKEDDFLRVWYNFGGDQILIYLPIPPRPPAIEKRPPGV